MSRGFPVCRAVVALCMLPAAAAAQTEPDQDVYVLDGGLQVIKVNATSGQRSLVSSNTAPSAGPAFVRPTGIAIDPGGSADFSLVVADPDAGGGTGAIIGVNPTDGARTVISDNTMGGQPFVDPTDVTVEADGNILVVDPGANGNTGVLFRVDPATGARTVLSRSGGQAGPAFSQPVAVARSSGDIIVADRRSGGNGGLFAVDPVTGNRSILSQNGNPAGAPTFSDPNGIPNYVHTGAGGLIPLADRTAFGNGGIINVDPITRQRTRVSSNMNPPLVGAPIPPPLFGAPSDVEVLRGLLVGGAQTFVVADDNGCNSGFGCVMTVERATGTRTVLSDNNAPTGAPQFFSPVSLVVRGLRVRLLPLPKKWKPSTGLPGRPGRDRDGRAAAGKKLAIGYVLSGAQADITVAFDRLDEGRLGPRGNCRRGGRATGAKCVIAKRVGTVRQKAKPGRGTLNFDGTLKRRALPAARYRVTLSAKTAKSEAPPRSGTFELTGVQ